MDQDNIQPRSHDEHERDDAVPCTDCAGEIPDEDALQQKQRPLGACGDHEIRNEAEAPTTGHVTSHTTQTAQDTHLTDHHPTLGGCSSEAPGTPTGGGFSPSQAAMSDLCSVLPDVDGMQRHEYPLAAHQGAASTAGMPPGLDENRRLSFHTVALLRQGVALWKTSARGRAWCLRLGMTSSSWDGWAQMHVHPLVAMQFYFLPTIGVMLTVVYLFTGLSRDTNSLLFYAVTVPHALNLAVAVSLNCAMFRFGPQVVFHRLYQPMVLLTVALELPAWYVGYIGPQDTVPWNNRFKFLVFGSASILLAHLSGAAGGIPGEHPAEPRTSIRKPVLHATIQTLRLTDALTDLSLIAELVMERRRGCWLFGVPGRCGAWNWLIGLFCTFAAVDLVVALAISVRGRESMDSSQAKKRNFFAWQCLALACELGIVACTLVHLYNLRHPGNTAREDFSPTQQLRNIALTFFSLATTLFTFTLNLVGTSKALAAVRSAVARVSHRGFRQCQVTPRTSHTTA